MESVKPDTNYAGLEKKTMWFVLGALAVLLLLFGAVATKQNYFSQTTSLFFFTPNAQGLNEGMAVKFVGFKIGSVEEISMEPNATIKVRLSVLSKYIPLIGQDARARLIKEALVGESVIEIMPGSPQSRHVSQNGVLVFERGQDIGELAENLAGQVQPILHDIRKLTSSISDSGGDIREAIKNINQASKELLVTGRQLDSLTRDVDRKLGAIYGKLDHALDQANAGLATANHGLKRIDEALPGLILKVDTSLGNVRDTTAVVKKVTADSADVIPGILHNGDVLVRDSREIVSGAKKAWPIRNFVPSPAEGIPPLDGYVEPGPRAVTR